MVVHNCAMLTLQQQPVQHAQEELAAFAALRVDEDVPSKDDPDPHIFGSSSADIADDAVLHL